MPRIFICYRRHDSAGHAGRLRDALAARLPAWQIFRDLDTIGPGEDFLEAMARAISDCDVFLVVIGARWLTATREDGMRRLDDPQDHVRRELIEALSRGVRIIPVLVSGVEMPRTRDLPPDLAALATRNAITLDDEGWEFDVERLTAAIDPEAARSARRPGPDLARAARPRFSVDSLRGTPRVAWAGLAAVLLVAAVVALSHRGKTPVASTVPSSTIASSVSEAAREPRSDQTQRPAPAATTGAPAPGVGAGELQATFPNGSDAELGMVSYEILDARVGRGLAGGSAIALRIRAKNEDAYDVSLYGGQFRLLRGEDVAAPSNALNAIVPAHAVTDGTVEFELPPSGAQDVALRIAQGERTADIPLDLSGRKGATAHADQEARRAGRTLFPVTVDPSRATLRFAELVCELQRGRVRRYAHKLALALPFRVHNRSRYDALVTDAQFRLVIGDLPRAPARPFQRLIRGEESAESEVVFDLPFGVQDVVLRARFGEAVGEIPLRLPPSASQAAPAGR